MSNRKEEIITVIKFFAFMNILALFICGIVHLMYYLFGDVPDGALNVYWICPLVLNAAILLSIYVIEPLFRKFMGTD